MGSDGAGAERERAEALRDFLERLATCGEVVALACDTGRPSPTLVLGQLAEVTRAAADLVAAYERGDPG